MQSDIDYCLLITRMTPMMHHCIRGFLLKHAGGIPPHEEDIQQWVCDDLDNHLDELAFEEREIVEARLLRTIRLRVSSACHGGPRDAH